MAGDSTGLADRLAERARQVAATVTCAIVPLDGGAPIRARADACLPTASAIKVLLLAALYAADAARQLLSRLVFETWGR